MSKLQGGCLCGGIRYEIDGPVGKILHCHCSMCRRPVCHIFTASKAPWFEISDGLPEFEEFPPADDIS